MKKKEVIPKHISPPDDYFWFYIGKHYYMRMQERTPYKFKFEKYIQNIQQVKSYLKKI